MGDGDFNEFRRLYDHQFHEHAERLDKVESIQMKHATDLTVLKVKAGMFGAATGGLVVVVDTVMRAML